MRVVVLPLTVESDSVTDEQLASSVNSVSDPKPTIGVPAIEGPPAYVPLLNEPFSEPPILTRPNGLPANPFLATSPPKGVGVVNELTPEIMRYLGTTVAKFTGQIHDTLLAARTAEARVQLQKAESQRQQEKAREVLNQIEKLKSERQDATKARLEQVRDGQKVLMSRVDRILTAMMRNASPEVSEHERKWFEELKRMRDEVVGRGRYDQDSLAARTSLVSSLHDVHRNGVHDRHSCIANSIGCCQASRSCSTRKRSCARRCLQMVCQVWASRRHSSWVSVLAQSTFPFLELFLI